MMADVKERGPDTPEDLTIPHWPWPESHRGAESWAAEEARGCSSTRCIMHVGGEGERLWLADVVSSHRNVTSMAVDLGGSWRRPEASWRRRCWF